VVFSKKGLFNKGAALQWYFYFYQSNQKLHPKTPNPTDNSQRKAKSNNDINI